jgi:hypothetical protein
MLRRHAIVGAVVLALAASAGRAVASGQNAGKPEPPAVVLDDGFEYAVLDFGVGAVPFSMMRRFTAKRYLWVKVQLTNMTDRLLAPMHWSSVGRLGGVPPTDNAGNTYRVETQSIRAPKAPSGRYQPGESSIDLILIPADEVLDTISDLHIGIADASRRYHGFVLHAPLTRLRDFDTARPDPAIADLPASLASRPPVRRK